VTGAQRVRQLARQAGFDLAGVATPQPPPHLGFLAEWVQRGYAGEMTYLSGQLEQRSDLRRAFPWARSLVCVGQRYDSARPLSTEASERHGWISRYAWGDDYHEVLRDGLERLRRGLEQELGATQTRVYVDTGPLAEKAYAAAAGLGAYGKNTCLLHPELGSWFFLGVVISDLALEPDAPRPDMCGSCTACLDACPTQAFPAPYVLDATRCISYLTIELRGAIPEQRREQMGREVFGCDICQDVCPWNRRRRQPGPAAFEPRPGLEAPVLAELAALDESGFRERFRRSPVRRAKRRGLLRNVAVALAHVGGDGAQEALRRLADDADPTVREHARWALARLRTQGTHGPAAARRRDDGA